jgi:hypothetical protein
MNKIDRVHRWIGRVLLLSFGSLFFIAGCDDGIIDDGNKLIFPEPGEGEVSFLNNVQPFLRLRCANATCHGSVSPADGRSFVNYASVMNSFSNISFVRPYDAEGSLFYQVATGVNPHLRNLGLRELTDNQRQGIRRWIDDGALNN